jgi:uncharacterized protein (TIGR02271 family)
MRQTVVGVFDKYENAQHAAQALQDSGFGPDAVHVTESTYEEAGAAPAARDPDEHRGVMESIRSFFAEVFGSGDDRDISQYAEAVRRGHAVVKVDAEDEPRVDAARQVLQDAGAIDIDERAAEWREQGWRGEIDERDFERTIDAGDLGTHAAAGSELEPSDASSVGVGARDTHRADEQVIPVLKEELEVGKRAVSTGGVRVYAHAVERPVQESLDLREERATVERRPVDRPASQSDLDAFKDRTVEVRETAEKPVVKKTARVVEEVVVGKDTEQRTQTISDSVRDTEVRVDRLGGNDDNAAARPARAFEDDVDYYRSDWRTQYGVQGGAYEDYEPAYRYGHLLGSEPRYAGRTWDELEGDARSDWEREHPGSAWERFKGAVRRGWERVTG